MRRVEVGHVRMAEEHSGKFARRRVQVQRLQIVQHIDVAVGDQHHIGLRQLAQRPSRSPLPRTAVTGAILPSSLSIGDVAHVAQMQDPLDPVQRVRTSGAVGHACR